MAKRPGGGFQEDTTRSKSASSTTRSRSSKSSGRSGSDGKDAWREDTGRSGGSGGKDAWREDTGRSDGSHGKDTWRDDGRRDRGFSDKDSWRDDGGRSGGSGGKDDWREDGGRGGGPGDKDNWRDDRGPGGGSGDKDNWRDEGRRHEDGGEPPARDGFEEDEDLGGDHHFDEFEDDFDDEETDEDDASSRDPAPVNQADLPIARVWSWQGRAIHLRARASQDQAVRRAAQYGFSDICLQVNGMRAAEHDRDFSYTGQNRRRSAERIVSALARSVEQHRQAGMAVHLMYFPAPTTRFMEGMIGSIEDVLRADMPIRSILLDAESNWRRHDTPDFEAACELVRTRLRPALADRGIALGFTDFTMTRTGAMLAEECDYLMPQAYSTRASGPREPGAMQARLHRRFADLDKPMVMALAAWKMRRARNMSIRETIEYTFDSVQDLRDPTVAEVAYWSIPAMRTTARNDAGEYRLNTPAESREIQRTIRDLNMQLADERAARHRLAMPD